MTKSWAGIMAETHWAENCKFPAWRISGLGIYKRKKESKKTRKHLPVHVKKNSFKKTRTCTRMRPRKKELDVKIELNGKKLPMQIVYFFVTFLAVIVSS